MSYKAYVFDAYGTLFDVHSVKEKIHTLFPNKGEKISNEWRDRQIHYFLVRQVIDRYRPFDEITKWALIDALMISDADANPDIIEQLMEQYKELKPFEEVPELKQTPQKLTIFSNGTRSMLEPLLKHNGLENTFGLLTADDKKVYKPHSRAYEYAHHELGFEKEEILFFSSNPWDITGAASYGFSTAWVNRSEQKWPELGVEPTLECSDLTSLPE